jgi:alpha-glucosidase
LTINKKTSLMMKKIICLTILLVSMWNVKAKVYKLESPTGSTVLEVSVEETIKYSISLNGTKIIDLSPISMEISDGITWGKKAHVRDVQKTFVSSQIMPVVKLKCRQIKDEYNLLTLEFKNYKLQFRAYEKEVAYRWISKKRGNYNVVSEQASFNFANDCKVWFPEEESFFTNQEHLYKNMNLSEIGSDCMGATGLLVGLENNVKVYISESDLLDYPGMYLKGDDVNKYSLIGEFPGVVAKEEQLDDRNVRPVEYADYIAKCEGPRNFPWRAIIISENDAELVESNLIYKLASRCKIEDTSWIKPGKVAWDWWNANNIHGVDFKSGVNNQTYQYYIDFAANNSLEYVILDEGWYDLANIMQQNESIDVRQLVEYGKKKNVGVILWVVWKALDDKLIEALDQFQEWGVKGIKMDFMQRDDQWMVNFYEKVARECAKRQLLIDYHGSYKPAGLNRIYPNAVSFESVKGLENTKWEEQPDPEHNVTIPFIRMVAGPMDYTPGAMINATKHNFKPVFNKPMSPGTRCHQLAMYVVFESPLQMLCDSPSNYEKETECMEFLSQVHSLCDDTKVLHAKVGEYIAMARRLDNKWYLGAMTNWDARTLSLDLSFLDDGQYTIKIWKDGVNADKYASDFAVEEINVSKDSSLNIQMAPGGGWTAVISKQ